MARLAAEDEQLARARQATGVNSANARLHVVGSAKRGDDQRQPGGREAALGSALIARLKAAGASSARLACAALEGRAGRSGPAQTGNHRAVWTAIRQTRRLRTHPTGCWWAVALVDQVLQDADKRYTVSGYAARMAKAFGRIYLGLDDGRSTSTNPSRRNRFIQGHDAGRGLRRRLAACDRRPGRLIQTGPRRRHRQRAGQGPGRHRAGTRERHLVRPARRHALIKEGGWHWQPNDEASCPHTASRPRRATCSGRSPGGV